MLRESRVLAGRLEEDDVRDGHRDMLHDKLNSNGGNCHLGHRDPVQHICRGVLLHADDLREIRRLQPRTSAFYRQHDLRSNRGRHTCRLRRGRHPLFIHQLRSPGRFRSSAVLNLFVDAAHQAHGREHRRHQRRSKTDDVGDSHVRGNHIEVGRRNEDAANQVGPKVHALQEEAHHRHGDVCRRLHHELEGRLLLPGSVRERAAKNHNQSDAPPNERPELVSVNGEVLFFFFCLRRNVRNLPEALAIPVERVVRVIGRAVRSSHDLIEARCEGYGESCDRSVDIGLGGRSSVPACSRVFRPLEAVLRSRVAVPERLQFIVEGIKVVLSIGEPQGERHVQVIQSPRRYVTRAVDEGLLDAFFFHRLAQVIDLAAHEGIDAAAVHQEVGAVGENAADELEGRLRRRVLVGVTGAVIGDAE
mmetsp:Transcript_27688/g.87798  ORF Transcript_27688/g.87798 Transcript_27688/m.87798 type:complete len:418 (-) Transcript_27688:921-2174(-)